MTNKSVTTKSTSSFSQKSSQVNNRPKSAAKNVGAPYWIKKQISTNQHQNFNYYSKQSDTMSMASEGVAQKVGVNPRPSTAKAQRESPVK